ncbi:heavy metal translocating P-type ATPase [Alkalibacillus aidingensis]|uniref:heavy metal translocating P-type ATPase n=1 Tax=Alkalibacillus aidingensis TaxID=2747607 RepID=UPI00166118C2|nr:heavy metal translocating P-type ATPase [Alkalibacillus aidingensis]
MSQETYYVKGMSCTSCAQTFEKNVKDLPTVEDAEVNFGASKITVYGGASVEQIEKAGAFENLTVTKEYEAHATKSKWSLIQANWHILLSFVLLSVGIYLLLTLGDSHPLTISIFIISIAVGGYHLIQTGLKNLIKFRFDMKTLMTIAVIGAALIGEWVEGAVVVILFAISEALERFSIDRARASIKSLMEIAPNTARVIRQGEHKEIDVSDIHLNDTVIIKPGEKIPVDGTVLKGSSAINQAAITGESVPVFKTDGDDVFAGTLNEEGYLEVNVTKLAEESTLAKIIHLVEEAQNEKAPAQQFVDRFAAYYTPLIMLIALGVATVPPIFFGLSFETWIYQGLAVLVVGCPCALVISTPVAIVTAIGNAARNGVLIKGGAYLETLGDIKAIAFDKTGTITQGTPVVTSYQLFDTNTEPEELFQKAKALEEMSQHPLAKAIIQYADQHFKQPAALDVQHFRSITGKGITGTIDGSTYQIGNPSMYEQLTSNIESAVIQLQQAGQTVVLVSRDHEIIGLIAIADVIRPMAKEMIEQLNQLNMKQTVLLTGDHEQTAQSISEQVGIKHYLAQLLPEDKQQQVKGLKNQYGQIAMVGDGVNDAPALASSDVGIAMGSAGTDTALETADIALMGDDLAKLPFTVRLSRRTLNIIKQNIVFALGTKLFALLLVIPGWLTLWIAILADMGATLLVTLNALRLLKVKE